MVAKQIGLTDKYVSERHFYASQEKYTAGEVVKILKKSKIKTIAKELVEVYQKLYNSYPEWHHSGFFKQGGRNRMGRTYFFTEEHIEDFKKYYQT